MVKRIRIIKKRNYPEVKRLYENFDVSENGEVCLAVGGDGTFLEAERGSGRPILPIRGGEEDSLGFHADVTLRNMEEIIKGLKEDTYIVEEYNKLRVICNGKICDAVNDVILFRASPKTIHCKVYYQESGEKDLLYPKNVRGDGLVFSGQMGSTAYNFFAHGPIIHGVDVIAVTPISANYTFSIVSGKDFCIEVTKNTGFLEYDGIQLGRLSKGDSFTVGKSDKKVKIVRLQKREKFSEKIARLCMF